GAVLYLKNKLLAPISNMLQDWIGTEARPGVERRPGVMERLSGIEDKVDVMTIKIADHAVIDQRVTALEVSALRADKRHEELMLELLKFQNILIISMTPQEGGNS